MPRCLSPTSGRATFRASNPAIHRLHVTYAQDTLALLDDFIHQLKERSRVPCLILAGLLSDERSRLIKSDAAYQEAAWRLLGGCPLD